MKNKRALVLFFIILFIPIFCLAKYCVFCGGKNPDEAVFCIECGKKFPETTEDKEKQKKMKAIQISPQELERMTKRCKGIVSFPFFSYLKVQNTYIVYQIIDQKTCDEFKIKQGDSITSINGIALDGEEPRSVEIYLSKNPAEKTAVSFSRNEENLKFDSQITCRESEFDGFIPIAGGEGVSVFQLAAINEKTPKRFEQILNDADKNNKSGIIIDLRCCISYSDYKPALQILQMLTPENEKIGSMLTFDNKKEDFISLKSPKSYIPISLLIDESVEGAAEWIAASLSYNQRAILTGANTAGKPMLIDWKKTDKKYSPYIQTILLPPNSASPQDKGYKPDTAIPPGIPPAKWVQWQIEKSSAKN